MRSSASDPYACLQEVEPRGWPRLQALLVDRVKRAALRRLHASNAGELLLLRMYLVGEESTEQALQDDLMPTDLPGWLSRQARQHLAEERQHVHAFAGAIAQRGGAAGAGEPDWLSRRKIARWKRLAQCQAVLFSQGVLVSAYAIGLCAEQMGVRVLRRHCDTIGAGHALYPLLAGILADETRHVRLCEQTLRRMVTPQELPSLEALLRRIRRIERGFGVSGAAAMYLAGCICAWRSRAPRLAR
jgi:hypothetical protein